MNAQVFQEERKIQIEAAMQHYRNVHQAYETKLRAAIAEPNGPNRASLVQEAISKNNELKIIVEGIIGSIKNANNGKPTEQSADLEEQVEKYKEQLQIISESSNRTSTLQSLANELSHAVKSYENYYIGYAIAVLILIIFLIILFMTTGNSGGDMGSSVVPEGPSPFTIPIKFDVMQ